MDKQVELLGKKLNLSLTKSASDALSARDKPLVAEMELYFSCLIRKKVRFKENMDQGLMELVNVNEHLAVRFRPVMTAVCGIDFEGDEPPLTDFPIKKIASFVPNWLRIDYKKNEWIGDFGF